MIGCNSTDEELEERRAALSRERAERIKELESDLLAERTYCQTLINRAQELLGQVSKLEHEVGLAKDVCGVQSEAFKMLDNKLTRYKAALQAIVSFPLDSLPVLADFELAASIQVMVELATDAMKED